MKKELNKYHDWYLTGIYADPNDSILKLELSLNKIKEYIYFFGVVRAEFNNFKMGNIILDIEVKDMDLTKENISKNLGLKKLFYLPEEDDHFKMAVENILQGRNYLVMINPSYGCIGQILCENFQEVELN